MAEHAEEARAKEVDCSQVVKLGLEYLSTYKAWLENDKLAKEIETQAGEKTVPCGPEKMALIEWLQTLLRLKDSAVAKKMEDLDFPRILLSLLKIHSMNSGLHLKIYSIFHDAMLNGTEAFIETVFFVLLYVGMAI